MRCGAPRAVELPQGERARATQEPRPAAATEAPEIPRDRTGRPSLRWAMALALVVTSIVVGFGLRRSTTGSPTPSQPVPHVRPEVTLVGQQFGPRLSPDGQRIAFAWRGPGQTGSWDIWLQQIGGDNPVQLTEHEHQERLATWSPDGQAIAFVRFAETEARSAASFACRCSAAPPSVWETAYAACARWPGPPTERLLRSTAFRRAKPSERCSGRISKPANASS